MLYTIVKDVRLLTIISEFHKIITPFIQEITPTYGNKQKGNVHRKIKLEIYDLKRFV